MDIRNIINLLYPQIFIGILYLSVQDHHLLQRINFTAPGDLMSKSFWSSFRASAENVAKRCQLRELGKGLGLKLGIIHVLEPVTESDTHTQTVSYRQSQKYSMHIHCIPQG